MTHAGGSPPDDGDAPAEGAKAAKPKGRKGSRQADETEATKRRGRGRTKVDVDAVETPGSDGDVEASDADGTVLAASNVNRTDLDVDASDGDGNDLELDASEARGSDDGVDVASGSEIDVANGHSGAEVDVDASNGHGGSAIHVDLSNGHGSTIDVDGSNDTSTSHDLAVDASTGDGDGEAIDGPLPELPSSAAAMDARQLKHLVEALIFASDKPVTAQRLRQLTRVGEVRRLEQALAELAEDYRDRGLVLQQVSGGYQFRTRTQFSVWVQQLIAGRPVRLSRAQLETLAIVAYRQPITRPEIDDIRGVDSSQTLKLLLDRGLVRILGKKEEAGRPMLYGTTKEFLDFFSLGDLRELPTLREYSELTDESRRVISDRLGDEAPSEDMSDESDALVGEDPETRSLEDDLQAYVDADDEPHLSTHVGDVTNGIHAAPNDDEDDVQASTSDRGRDRVSAETSDPIGDHPDRDVRGHERAGQPDHAHVQVSAERSDLTIEDQDDDADATASDSCDRVSAETSARTDDHDGGRHDQRGLDGVFAETSDQSNDHDAVLRGHESHEHAERSD
ncbi:MAG TPA: SMC-Scp complex subunit ScpB, partial [Kofleriaceae bacterium]|nr:SMC-Scp complex subunit ScpB [Kofleriaceae bacterium]